MSTATAFPLEKEMVPELMGVTEVCKTLGTVSSNLDKIAGLPAPIAGPHVPHNRIAGGRLWVADEIREFAAQRSAARKQREKDRKDRLKARKALSSAK